MPRKRTKDELKEVVKGVVAELTEEQLEGGVEDILDIRPGSIHRGMKKTWTRQDVDAYYSRKVTFVPDENRPITLNGVTFWLIEGVENTVPEVIKNMFEEAKRLQRDASRGVMTSQGYMKPTGVGGLIPEE